jgi:hypothetical protein
MPFDIEIFTITNDQLDKGMTSLSQEAKDALAPAKKRACETIEGMSPACLDMTEEGTKVAYGPNIDPEKLIVLVCNEKQAVLAEVFAEEFEEPPNSISGTSLWWAINESLNKNDQNTTIKALLYRIGWEGIKNFKEEHKERREKGYSCIMIALVSQNEGKVCGVAMSVVLPRPLVEQFS